MESTLISLMVSGYQGGIIRSSLRLANEFHSSGYRVHLLPNKTEFPFLNELKEGIEIRNLSTFHRFSGVPFMAGYMLKYKPSVMLTSVFQHTELAVKARSLARSTCRIYAVVRIPYNIEWADINHGKRSSRIKRLKKYYPKTDGIIAISDGVASGFCQMSGIERPKVTTIHNPAYNESINDLKNEPVEHPWFSENAPPVILTVGRLERSKNLYLLVEAFEQIRKNMPCRLVLIGDGSLRSELEMRAGRSPYAEDISFLGFKVNPFPYMRLATVFVLSSSWEGFGNVLVEALATGTPVVATDCPGGPGEILAGGKYGRLVPMDDRDAMAKAIYETIMSPPDKGFLIRGAERFRASRIAEQYLRLFDLDVTCPLVPNIH